MNISNLSYSCPSQVKEVFYSYLPFGSDYVIFCSEYSTSRREFTCLYRKIGQKNLSEITAVSTRSGSTASWSGYDFDEVSLVDTEYSGFSVSDPYYAFSNAKGQGQYETLPSTDSLVCLMLIICASLSVLRTVFGGIKLWSAKR